MQKRHRIFIAINLPEDIKRELEKRQTELRSRFTLSQNEDFGEWAKWTSKDNLHITLEFLGNLTDIEIGDVCKIADEVVKKHNSFSINLNKICYGGVRPMSDPRLTPRIPRIPRMIWAMGEKSDKLADLKRDLQECLVERISFKPEPRSFTSHITLAKILEWEFRKFELEERPEINENIDFVIPVESIEVMESELKRGGPAYTVLESCELSK